MLEGRAIKTVPVMEADLSTPVSWLSRGTGPVGRSLK